MKRSQILNTLRGSNSKTVKRIPAVKDAREALGEIYTRSNGRQLSDVEQDAVRVWSRSLHDAIRQHTGGAFALLNH